VDSSKRPLPFQWDHLSELRAASVSTFFERRFGIQTAVHVCGPIGKEGFGPFCCWLARKALFGHIPFPAGAPSNTVTKEFPR